MRKEEMGKLAIELIQAEMEGKTAQYSDKGENCWEDFSVISAFGANAVYSGYHDFRIKPEKKLVPFTWDDRDKLMGKWVMSKEFPEEIHMILSIERSLISLNHNTFEYDELLSEFTFLDGSPCGKEVEL